MKDWSRDTFQFFLYGEEQTPDHPTKAWHKTAKYLGLISRIKISFFHQGDGKYSKEIGAITQTITCPTCHGRRFNEAARTAILNGKTMAECSVLPLSNLKKWLGKIVDTDIQPLLKDLNLKIDNLITVGLSYLRLDRRTSTLSGGEGQKIIY